MSLLKGALKSEGRYVGFVTGSWTALAAIALVGRKIRTGAFGSPEFVFVLLLIPIVAIFWSVAMWRYVIGPRIRNQTEDKEGK